MGVVLGSTASFIPKGDCWCGGNSKGFGDRQTSALILVLSGDWLCDLGPIAQPLWASVASADQGNNSYLVIIKLIAKFLTYNKHWKMESSVISIIFNVKQRIKC